MFTIRMNEAAASALQPLAPADPTSAVPVVSQALRDKFAQGLTYNEGALTFAEHDGQWVAAPASASAAIVKMGWQDLTGYECNVNAFHLEDYAPVHVAISDDRRPQIRYEDQVMLLRLGLVVADSLFGLIQALPEPVPVRCVINANDTAATFRFHQIRSGEDWVNLELDEYRMDMMVVVDRHP
ncbi:hypothetical protein [Sphaerimonospora thailandensis]|uniref:Uncharacterized protein n=1 Tax=Sphaerimonospora thailandensis TaxID=795644 RepID=A0A8J3VY33_9ACTN|nr:hypothetical protein [Sphaerimonospora thailandensis]GIH69559.1 hypothetical protein Mth01_18120 [Sphaerimonospora thailandensis]